MTKRRRRRKQVSTFTNVSLSAASLEGATSSCTMLPIFVFTSTVKTTIVEEKEAGTATVKKKKERNKQQLP